MTKHAWIAAALITAAAFGGEAYAQGGGMPAGFDKEMILKQIKETLPQVIAQSPEETLKVEGIVIIKYKKLPTDPKKIAEILGKDISGKTGGMLPEEQINEYIGMFEKDITAVLNDALKDIGTIEVLKELKIKSKKIPVGIHRIGIAFDGEKPKAFRIFNEDKEIMKKAIEIRVKTKSSDKSNPLEGDLALKLIEPKSGQKEGKENFKLEMTFLRFKARTKSKVEVSGD